MNLNIINQLDGLSRSNRLGLITGGVEKGTIQERNRVDKQFSTSYHQRKLVPIIQVNGPGIVLANSFLALKKWIYLVFIKLEKFIKANSSALILAMISALIVSLFEKLLSIF
jgi:hypothetical protein